MKTNSKQNFKTKEIMIEKLCNDNNLEIVNKNIATLNRSIKRPSINHVGLELMGHFYNSSMNLNIIG